MKNLETAATEVGGLSLPPNLEPIRVAGEGSRSIIFKASYRGETVAMKVYRPAIIEQYRNKYDVNIAVYEMAQNRKLRKIPALLPFTAKALTVLGHDGKHSLMFLQEFIDGIHLTALAEQNRGLPPSVLEAGETILREAEANELQDLDLYYKDVVVRQQSGDWLPVLHDFNHYVKTEEPSRTLLGRILGGTRSDPLRKDRRYVEDWRTFSEQCASQ